MKKTITILLTSVGRRDYIVRYFKEIKKYNCRIIACNSIENTTGMWAADKAFLAPPIKSKEYIPFLMEICEKERVDILLSLFDLDVLYLSQHKHQFKKIGVTPIIPDPEATITCLDKIRTNKFLNSISVNTPKIFNSLESVNNALEKKELEFPLVLKPQWGQGSIATEIVNDEKELYHGYHFLKHKVQKTTIADVRGLDFNNQMLIQEYIKGDEYGVDCLNNLNAKPATVVVKKKYAMRSGETDAAVTVEDNQIFNVGMSISNNLHHVGMLDVDLIKNENGIYVIDMNPRFGGGYPFSHVAGINIPEIILDWYFGDNSNNSTFNYTKNTLSLKGIQIISKKVDI